jgi:hypothetical protein
MDPGFLERLQGQPPDVVRQMIVDEYVKLWGDPDERIRAENYVHYDVHQGVQRILAGHPLPGDEFLMPYIQHFQRMHVDQLDAAFDNNSFDLPGEESAALAFRFKDRKFSYDKKEPWTRLAEDPSKRALVEEISREIPYLSEFGELRDKIASDLSHADPTEYRKLLQQMGILPLTWADEFLQRDVVQASRAWLEGYQKFLQNPTQKQAQELLSMLNSMPSLLLPSTDLPLVLGYDQLNRKIRDIPKSYSMSRL